MRLGNRITPAVSRWRATLTDEAVARRMPDAKGIDDHRRAILGTLDQALASTAINHAERDSLRAIVDNPGRDQAEAIVLMLTLSQLRGFPLTPEWRTL